MLPRKVITMAAAYLVTVGAATTTTVLAANPAPRSDAVRACQVGYLPGETKFAVITAPASGAVLVRRASDNSIVLRVEPGPEVHDIDTGDRVRPVDFSALREPGTYFLDVPGVGAGDPFTIADDVFARPFRLAMLAFTGLRCGTAISLGPEFPEFRHAPCHTAPAPFHASSGKTGTLDCTGGWHDAGDYGRYVVNSGITTGTLLWAYELNEAALRPVRLGIPESGGPLPDVLAEIKWNLDWMLKMQDREDGGVWHKATTANFPGFVMPEDDTKSPILVVGTGKAPYKTTAGTADFAAACAIAARVYRPFDAAYADRCLAAAEQAWAWVSKHPDSLFAKNPEGISTGGYEDRNPADELLWAAAELFRTTGKPAYNEHFVKHQTRWTPTVTPDGPQGWPDVRHMAMFTYVLGRREGTDTGVADRITSDVKAAADKLVARSRENGYRIPLRSSEYYWGSNSVAANYGMMLRLADRITPSPDYANAAQDVLHYLLGRNTFATSYVTQVGARWPMHPHHRPSGADKVQQPWPGMLVGGPNAEGKSPPARQWHDVQDDYRTNEIAINWNAPLAFLLAEALPKPAGAKP